MVALAFQHTYRSVGNGDDFASGDAGVPEENRLQVIYSIVNSWNSSLFLSFSTDELCNFLYFQ